MPDAWAQTSAQWNKNWNKQGFWGPRSYRGWGSPGTVSVTSPLGVVTRPRFGALGAYGATAADLFARASAQTAQAASGQWIDGFPTSVPAVMTESPANTVGAHYRASWWLATAARVQRSYGLAGSASAALAKGRALESSHMASRDVGAVSSILQTAASTARSNGAGRVAEALQRLSSPAMIRAAQDASPTGLEMVQGGVQQASDYVESSAYNVSNRAPSLPSLSLPSLPTPGDFLPKWKDYPLPLKLLILAPPVLLGLSLLGGGVALFARRRRRRR